jgi:hypothetical protein
MNSLVNWYQAAEKLKAAKSVELAFRKQVVEEYFPVLEEGAQSVEIEGNAELICTQPYAYSVDADTLDEGLTHIPATKQDKIVTWKPSMSVAVYRRLTKKARNAFTAECVTIKPGTPSLKIKPSTPAS